MPAARERRGREKARSDRLTKRLATLEKKIHAYNASFDFDELIDALHWADKNNNEIKKGHGADDYFAEPLRVVENLVAYARADRETILAAVLYGAVPTATYRIRDERRLDSIKDQFRERVASIVDRSLRFRAMALPHLKSGATQSLEENRNLDRLMLLGVAEEPAPIAIRGVNLIGNLERVIKDREERTYNPAKPVIYSQSVIEDWQESAKEVIAPLADAAGLHWLRTALLNLCYQISQPVSYAETCRQIAEALQKGDKKIIKTVTEHIEKTFGWTKGDQFIVEFRAKSAFSAHEKLMKKSFADDLLGLRIILKPSVIDWMDGQDIQSLSEETRADLKEDLGKQCRRVYGSLSRTFGRGNKRKTGIKLNPATGILERYSPIEEGLRTIAESRNLLKDDRHKDYIAKPKGAYEAIHDVMWIPIGEDQSGEEMLAKIECHIVDTERHHQNTYGKARHSGYKGDLVGYDDAIAQWRLAANEALAGKSRAPSHVLVSNIYGEIFDISQNPTVAGFLKASKEIWGSHIVGFDVNNGYDPAFRATNPETPLPIGAVVTPVFR
jgi:(p)ppGpp synthase/HD superfamily hydrolase